MIKRTIIKTSFQAAKPFQQEDVLERIAAATEGYKAPVGCHMHVSQNRWDDFLICLVSFMGNICCNCKSTIISGWWFQTFFMFHNIWDNPSH